MKFTKAGNLALATHITGPTHLLLGIEFGLSDELIIETIETKEGVKISPEEVATVVSEAVEAANLKYNATLKVARIRFLPSDTGGPVNIATSLTSWPKEKSSTQKRILILEASETRPNPADNWLPFER